MQNQSREISFFTGGLGGGGAEKVCVTLANGLSELGWKVNLIVLDSTNAKYHTLVNSSVNLIYLNVRARYSFFKLYKYIKKNPISLAFSFSHELTVLLVLIRYLMPLNFKIVSRNINNLQLNRENATSIWTKYVVFTLVKLLYGQSDFVINQCKAMEDGLLEWIPNLKGKTCYIYNPVNIESLNNHKPIVIEDDYILCVGRLEKQKAFHRAIEAFDLVTGDYPKLKLYIIGDGSLKNDLKKLVSKLGIEERVIFIPFTSDIGAYYKEAKFTLLTSLYEGFPNVLVESISVGTPVVSVDCPSGPSEIIVEGVNGYLVEQRCLNDLSEKIAVCLNTIHNKKVVCSTSNQFMVDSIIKEYQNFLIAHGGNA